MRWAIVFIVIYNKKEIFLNKVYNFLCLWLRNIVFFVVNGSEYSCLFYGSEGGEIK